MEMEDLTFHELGRLSQEEREQACYRRLENLSFYEDGEGGPEKRRRLMSPADSGIGTFEASLETSKTSGVILEVVMENFLSHSKMVIYLNRDINFITGMNGSGKSAILTAIIVALGGTATSTGRGASIKDFVKHGTSAAKVTCVISNDGKHIFYKKDLYGEKIIVERILLKDGGSRIKMKTGSGGKIISTKMEDLRAMTLKLGIQVNNPISVLDQNSARHFLNESKPEKKFELFMKGTNIQSLIEIMNQIEEDLRKTNQELNMKERQLRDINAEVNKAKEGYEKLKKLEEDRKTSLMLKMELLWAQARDYKLSQESTSNQLKLTTKKKEELNHIISKEEITDKPYLDKIESSKKNLEALNNRKKEIETERKNICGQLKAIKKREQLIDEEISLSKVTVEKSKNFILEYKSEIETQEKRMLPEHERRRQEQQEELSNMENNAKLISEGYGSKKLELQDLQSRAVDLRNNLKQINNAQKNYEKELDRITKEHLGYKSSKITSLSRFGPCMPELVKAINNTDGFKEKPLGPLGSFIEINDAKWALAVENAIGSLAYGFAVSSLDDEKLLKNLIRRICVYGPKIPIRRLAFAKKPFDTSRTAAYSPQYSNILDVITICDIRARNILIEMCHLDTTLLIPSGDECYELLHKSWSVPKNCRKAFTIEGDYYIPAPTYGTYFRYHDKTKYLSSSSADVIREIKLQILKTQEILRENEQTCSAVKNEQKVVDDQIKLINAEAKKMLGAYDEIQVKIQHLKEELQIQPDINTVALLREEISDKEKFMKEIILKLNELESKLVQIPEAVRLLRKSDDEELLKLEAVNCDIEKLKIEQSSWVEARKELELTMKDQKKKLEAVTKEESQLLLKVQQLGNNHTEMVNEAKKYESHVVEEFVEQLDNFVSKFNTDRPVKTIDCELCSISKRIESFEKAIGSSEIIETDYHEKVSAFNAVQVNLKRLWTNAKLLEEALKYRRTMSHTVKNITSVIVSHQFGRVLQSRNCSGKIIVDFKAKTLDITVHPVDEGERTGKGTSSLSGGERSSATVSFIVALWNVTDLPFYFLDEFDVFMDENNREFSLRLLQKFAEMKPGHQFCFITPHTLAGVCDSPKVGIFRLPDPERQCTDESSNTDNQQ